MEACLFTDGGSRGNPGPAAVGGQLLKQDGSILGEFSEYIGHKTNNEAEYLALIKGLEIATTYPVTRLNCYLDSELIVKQLQGQYRIKNHRLQVLAAKAMHLAQSIPQVIYDHVPREKNRIADSLVNKALNEKLLAH